MDHIRNVDLNLLIVFECLLRLRNVSRVAEELGLTQSAVSHALQRLRDHYDDPLFVRIARGVEPTDLAHSLRDSVVQFVQLAGELSSKQEKFIPAKAKSRVVISTTDYFELVVGSKIIQRLKVEAPQLQVSIRPTYGQLPKAQLEAGTYHMAIAGFYKDLPAGFYRMNLFEDQFMVAYRKGLIKSNELTEKLYYEKEHMLITLQGDFKDGLSRIINGKKYDRKIRFGSSNFASVAWTLSESDMLLTAPSLLLKRFQQYFPIEVKQSPIEQKKLYMQMVWHGLTHETPLYKWIRQVIKEECG